MKSKTIIVIFKLVMAECRGSWHRLIFFIACIAIGVGAVMSVKSFSANIANSIQRESKSLIASDIEIRGSWPLSDEELKINQLGKKPQIKPSWYCIMPCILIVLVNMITAIIDSAAGIS